MIAKLRGSGPFLAVAGFLTLLCGCSDKLATVSGAVTYDDEAAGGRNSGRCGRVISAPAERSQFLAIQFPVAILMLLRALFLAGLAQHHGDLQMGVLRSGISREHPFKNGQRQVVTALAQKE